ncbi:MAG: sulfotransferase [Nannocystaceae bacterium]|nr:sulfotransferase [Nannocystaceae bacterium]
MVAPLFLLAPPRSYTSLINAMLGQHPQAFGLPELCLFNGQKLKDMWIRDTDEISNASQARQGLLRAVAEIYAGEQTRATVAMAGHWAAARQEDTTAEVYREVVAAVDPLMTVEKSPSYTIDIERLLRIREAFPNARYVHLTRHPVGQCKSVMKMNEGAFALFANSIEFQDDRAMVEPQFAWHDLNINILNFLDTIPAERKLRLQGEKVMSDPPVQLARVCNWLGLRDDAEAVEEMMHPERSPFACFGPLTALFGNDPNFLRGPTFRPHKVNVPRLDEPVPWRDDGRSLHPRVVALAEEFGYS